jgi:sugar phosphate permease
MPRVFYGWYIVAASLVVMAFGIGGGLYLFGVLVPPLLSEFAWTHAEVSGANSLAMIVMGLAGPVVGRLIDRCDPRLLMSTSAVCCGLGFGAQGAVGTLPALNDVATALTQLYVCYALYGVGLAGIGYVPVNTIVSRWFAGRRGLALGIVAVGVGLGGFLTIPAGWLVDGLGWRAATAIIGAAIIAVVLPLVALVMRLQPQEMGLEPDGRNSIIPAPSAQAVDAPAVEPRASVTAVLTSRTFWALALAFGVYTVTVTIIRVFGIALLEEKGLQPPGARFVMSALALWGILGKVVFGALTDRVPSRLVATAAFVLAAVGTLLLLGRARPFAVAAFIVVYGLPMGGIAALQPVLVAEYFGPSSFSAVYGTLVLLLTLGAAAGPVIAGRIYDVGGGYQPTLVACTVASGASAFVMMAVRRLAPARRSGVTAES